MRTYNELIQFESYEDRLKYLMLEDSSVCDETFGPYRYINQAFYKSSEWRSIRDYVITRDCGFDLAVPGYEIPDTILIHHINPIRLEDITESRTSLLVPDNLVCVSLDTHNIIHYGRKVDLPEFKERSRNDTCPWKKLGGANG